MDDSEPRQRSVPPSLRRVAILTTVAALSFVLSACILSSSDDKASLGNGGTITVGQTVTGTITEKNYGWQYTLTLTEQKSITIKMDATSGDLDPYLELKDSNGTLLAWDDDSGWSVNAEIRRTLQAGTYTIIAQAYEGEEIGPEEVGNFSLTVIGDAIGTGGAITIGGTATNTISESAYAWRYTLVVTSNASLSIAMDATSGNLDPYLELYNEMNTLVASNDDGGTGVNALIQYTFTPGTYTILAGRFALEGGGTTGTFSLTVSTN